MGFCQQPAFSPVAGDHRRVARTKKKILYSDQRRSSSLYKIILSNLSFVQSLFEVIIVLFCLKQIVDLLTVYPRQLWRQCDRCPWWVVAVWFFFFWLFVCFGCLARDSRCPIPSCVLPTWCYLCLTILMPSRGAHKLRRWNLLKNSKKCEIFKMACVCVWG